MYKESRSFEERCRESATMLIRFPDRVPIVIEPRANAPPIDKRKFMTPKDINFAQLMFVVRKRLAMTSQQNLFFFTGNNSVIIASQRISDIYSNHADEDGFLYVCYSLENTFG